MNLPNQLTIARLAITMLFVAALSIDFAHSRSLGLLLFVVASVTDFLDGYIARKHNLITRFGKLMDPLVDKVLMCAGFVVLTAEGQIPAWMVVTILAREFLVTGLRLIASAEGMVLAAERLGKHKTIWQIITVIYFLALIASEEPAMGWLAPVFRSDALDPRIVGGLLLWLTLLLTIVSGLSYAAKNLSLFREEKS